MGYNLSLNAQDILCVTGNIDLTNVNSACMTGKKIIDTVSVVRVDLSGLAVADSSCLAMLVEWLRCAKAQNKDIVFMNMPQFLLDLGRVCGLDTILPIDKVLQFNN